VTQHTAIHQFHSGTALGDAITNQMLELQGLLRRMGHESEVFAEHIPVSLQDRVRSIHGYRGSRSELLLVHHSIGYDAFDEVVSLPNDEVVVYHNVTPERYFEDEGVRHYVRQGREQLELLAHRALFGVAVSNFNRREMLAAGFRGVEVLPVRVDFREFAPRDRSARAAEHPSDDWLYVGRLVANKCQHELVRAFAVYASNFESDARLVLVGDRSATDYVDEVRRGAAALGLSDRVVVLGKITDRQLTAAFAGAGVFVSLSEHEGFGVPILEAMAAGVPVVAFGAAAIPETMGGAGVLLRSKEPELVAATVHAVQSDAGLRQRLVQRQFARVDQVGNFDIRRLLQRVVDRASGYRPPREIQVQGPFETSYSLAIMNRRLAEGLDEKAENAVSLYATEGPGDYRPRDEDLSEHPAASRLFERSREVPFPDVVIRQMFPPRVIDTPGGITCEYFGWEESRIPEAMAEDFNRYLDGLGVTSNFVRDVLRASGVDIPIRVVGNGVEAPDTSARVEAPELADLRGFTFLHISSAFPRKGVDALLEAYFSAFDGRSDVTLLLKTFPNPHNGVREILDRLRSHHPSPPDVRWIDRDLGDDEIGGLYGLADCYVHAARGEGFGLPVAEAMAAEVPVISVAYSGLADFVDDRTAVTVPYRLEPAQTHLDIPHSVWAEPDRQLLAREMQRMVDRRRSPEIEARVRRARELIATRFSWAAAVDRWIEFIRDLEEGAGPLHVAMVSTWNSRCGIAENTRYIVAHAGDSVDYEIFAEVGIEPLDPLAEPGVVRTWRNRWEPELDELEKALGLSTAEVVHIQFNFGFYEFQRMAALIERELDRRGVVLTLHRTLDYDDRGELLSLRQIGSTLAKVDRLIVHQQSDADYLAEMGLSDNVSTVPIGTAAPVPSSPEEIRSALKLGPRPIIGTFGFLLPHKGTLELLRAVDAVREEFPDVLLLALCARYPNVESKEYEEQIRGEIEVRGMEDNVMLVTEYLPDENARMLLGAADMVVLPYRNTGESSSATLRFVLPLGRAVVVTDEPIFTDSRDAVFTVDGEDPPEIAAALRRLLFDDDLRQNLADRAAHRAQSLRWSRVVADHREIYAAASRAGRARRERRELAASSSRATTAPPPSLA
jgi:glycosyltransferase involved in cell wall biosynthesis